MNPLPVDLLPNSDEEKFLNHKHKDRWDRLKPVIVDLYTGNYGRNGSQATIDQIANFMRTHYSFHAAASEYPHHFRAWGVNDRRLTKEQVEEIAIALGRRSTERMSTSRVSIEHGKRKQPLDERRVKRHLKNSNSSVQPEKMQLGWLSSWNLPYAALVSALPKSHEAPSPYGPQHATPGYLKIDSPEATTSPGQESGGPSPNTQLFLRKARELRTSLFLQGRLKDLIISMSQDDRRICVDYFHQFYIHGLHVAKNWGSPPSMMPINSPPAVTPQRWHVNSPWTPSSYLNLPSSPAISGVSPVLNSSSTPTQLCRWSIHLNMIEYEAIPDEENYTEHPPASFQNSLHDAIASGNFTDVQSDSLPLQHETIIQSLQDNPVALQLDSWKLAIIAGNCQLLEDLGREAMGDLPHELDSIHPFHLAAAFINGGGPCCAVFTTLTEELGQTYLFRHYVDDLGHTVLDALMVSILRSHTSIHPDTVSYGFASLSRFPGEEKEICGRWDVDSPEVQELFQQGYARIPNRWKHPFCHSAVQAVCHSIMLIFGSASSPQINTLSGLFLRRCSECGRELRLGPFHTLVVTAFFLGQSGMAGETLFGPLAILICLVSLDADVTLKVNISVEEILKTSQTGQCQHREMSPAELMQAVPNSVIQAWSNDCRVGWACILQVLLAAENLDDDESDAEENDGYESDDSNILSYGRETRTHLSACELDDSTHIWWNFRCIGRVIGLVWATVQAELLTYRRVGERDPWISNNFSMRALQAWLEEETETFETPLVRDQMIKRHSKCGWFLDNNSLGKNTVACHWALAENACSEQFTIMDDYKRASFSYLPEIHGIW